MSLHLCVRNRHAFSDPAVIAMIMTMVTATKTRTMMVKTLMIRRTRLTSMMIMTITYRRKRMMRGRRRSIPSSLAHHALRASA